MYACSTSEAISPGMFPPAPQTDIYLIRRRATLTIEFKLALLGGWSPPDWQSMFGLVSEGAVKKVVAIIHEFLKKKKYHDKNYTQTCDSDGRRGCNNFGISLAGRGQSPGNNNDDVFGYLQFLFFYF